MKKSFTTAWVLMVVALALLLPAATTAAAPISTAVLTNKCLVYPANGWVSYEIKFKAKIRTDGTYAVDQFVISSLLQYKMPPFNGNWQVANPWPDQSKSVAPYTTQSLALLRTVNWANGNVNPSDPNRYRIKFVLKAYDNGTQLYSKTLYSKACGG